MLKQGILSKGVIPPWFIIKKNANNNHSPNLPKNVVDLIDSQLFVYNSDSGRNWMELSVLSWCKKMGLPLEKLRVNIRHT